jgi:hypothetical protein
VAGELVEHQVAHTRTYQSPYPHVPKSWGGSAPTETAPSVTTRAAAKQLEDDMSIVSPPTPESEPAPEKGDRNRGTRRRNSVAKPKSVVPNTERVTPYEP